MIFSVISIFPEMFDAFIANGIVARALQKKLFDLKRYNPRDFTTDPYRRIDDKTFGGGAGMVMKIEPLEKALECAIMAQNMDEKPLVIYLSPQGKPITQQIINNLAKRSGIIFVSGRYEGIDERFIERNVDLELSIGDYVVSGGELPTMMVIDAIVRQIPEALNSQESVQYDSFMDGVLDCPHYTHPREFKGVKVPDELLSGNHEKIRIWRLQQSLWRTYLRRPELLSCKKLTKEESRLLNEIISRNKIRKQS